VSTKRKTRRREIKQWVKALKKKQVAIISERKILEESMDKITER